ncbi:hypothetical protein GBAR_LOCUS14013 [Geodia barretti]|uniref:Uncharacterized protein n=1 Tax=Geodia barretti TaxID=519541 RepID=A0AA35WRL6_GEOBA|nr:hypothetical protein GBAR_LOCUS14013 [Geodia barretti]
MDVSDAKVVDVVEESPRRSFYSSSSRKRPSTSHMKELLEGRITQAVGNMTQGSWKPEASIHCPSSYDNENPLIEETNIVAESPSSSDWQSTKNNSTLLQTTITSDDPSVFGDSASMVAFALSTPTKDDKFNFENALDTF